MTISIILAQAVQAAQATGQAITQVAKGATAGDPYDELNLFMTQIPLAGWVVWIIETLKASRRFRWINEDSDAVNRMISMVAAFLTSAGLNFAMQGTLTAGGTITITFPAVGALVHFFVADVGRSYLMQQMTSKILTTQKAVHEAAESDKRDYPRL